MDQLAANGFRRKSVSYKTPSVPDNPFAEGDIGKQVSKSFGEIGYFARRYETGARAPQFGMDTDLIGDDHGAAVGKRFGDGDAEVF
jgi:hypothetical protein